MDQQSYNAVKPLSTSTRIGIVYMAGAETKPKVIFMVGYGCGEGPPYFMGALILQVSLNSYVFFFYR